MYKAIVRYKELGIAQDRPRSGRPSLFKDPALRKCVKQLLDRNPERKCRSLAKHWKIKRETLRSYLGKKFGVLPFKKKKKGLFRCLRRTRNCENKNQGNYWRDSSETHTVGLCSRMKKFLKIPEMIVSEPEKGPGSC